MPILVTSEIIGLFVNKTTVNGKYYYHNRENLLQAIQIQLSKKLETFSQFFSCISEIFIKF